MVSTGGIITFIVGLGLVVYLLFAAMGLNAKSRRERFCGEKFDA